MKIIYKAPMVTDSTDEVVEDLGRILAEKYSPFGAWIFTSQHNFEARPDGYGVVTLSEDRDALLTAFRLYAICIGDAEPRCVWGCEAALA